MDGEGQMMILSALVACLCLIGLVACIAAVDSGLYAEAGYLSDGGLDNVRWAQECALEKAAFYSSSYPWESRDEAALKFISDVNASMESLSGELLKHGIIYKFSMNRSLACEYVASHQETGTLNIGGVIVRQEKNKARVCGCAYDAFAYDGVTAYNESRIMVFD
jgi:hypothetical protein